MGFFDRLKSGLSRSREAINEIFYMGGEVDEDFWEDLEDTLVMGDMGGELAMRVADDLREQAARENLTRADQLRDALAKRLAQEFRTADRDPFEDVPSCVLFVGINGAGKTTTVGKLAGRARDEGKSCLIGGADTFRAAAIEQLPDIFVRSFTCTGSVKIGGDTITCPHAHGTMDFYSAFANSCNCVYAQLAVELGGETLERYARSAGLLESHDVSGIPTAAGSFDVGADDSNVG